MFPRPYTIGFHAHWRTRRMVAEGDDSFAFFIKQGGHWDMSQRGRDVSLGEGDAVGVLHGEPARKTISQVASVGLFVPRAVLAPLVGDVETLAMRVIPRDNEALRLLKHYSGILREDPALTTPEVRHLVVTHICDLIAVALGATSDGGEIACGRGVRAARLRTIKADILENLGSPELTVTAVARRQRVTPRYVHMLFETEGMTFSEFVLGQRLARAHRMLSDPHFAGLKISSVAFDGLRRSVLFQPHFPPPLWGDPISTALQRLAVNGPEGSAVSVRIINRPGPRKCLFRVILRHRCGARGGPLHAL